jgi:hypothetical protein
VSIRVVSLLSTALGIATKHCPCNPQLGTGREECHLSLGHYGLSDFLPGWDFNFQLSVLLSLLVAAPSCASKAS